MKETQDTNKWKIFHAHELEDVINIHTAQRNLEIQCNPYQNSNDIFHIEENSLNVNKTTKDLKKPK